MIDQLTTVAVHAANPMTARQLAKEGVVAALIALQRSS